MDDIKALEDLRNMSETDLLNLYHGYHGMDQVNDLLARENGRLRTELDEARIYLEMALIYDSDEKEERFNELLNETLSCTEHPFLNDWQLPCKCYLCRSYG